MRKFLFFIFLCTSLIHSKNAFPTERDSLFTLTQPERKNTLYFQDSTSKVDSDVISISYSPLRNFNEGDIFQITMPALGLVDMIVSRFHVDALSNINISARSFDPYLDVRLLASFNQNTIEGTISYNEVNYSISEFNGIMGIRQINDDPVEEQPIFHESSDSVSYAPIINTQSSGIQDIIIRVLVLYTPQANNMQPNIANRISHFMNTAQEVNANSGLNYIRFELAGSNLIANYNVTSTDSRAHLDSITSNSAAHNFREQTNADLVVLLTSQNEMTSSCGRAYIKSSRNKAYSVVRVDCHPLVFIHEIGHNFGALHDYDSYNDGHLRLFNGAYMWGYGYVDRVNRFRTVMAYDCNDLGGGCQRIPYWSSPDGTYNGHLLGTPLDNNKRVIEERASVIANFYPPNPSTTPTTSVISELCRGRGTISWGAISGASHYEVAMSPLSDIRFAGIIYSGTAHSYRYNITSDLFLYVRACFTGHCGEWSNPSPVRYYSTCM